MAEVLRSGLSTKRRCVLGKRLYKAGDPQTAGGGRWSLNGAVTSDYTELAMVWGTGFKGLRVIAHRRSWDMNFFGIAQSHSEFPGPSYSAHLIIAQISCWPGANLDDKGPPGGILS
jgi:hypothetical protein